MKDLYKDINQKLNAIKVLIIQGNYKKAIFYCNNIKKEVIKLCLDNKDEEKRSDISLLNDFKEKNKNENEIIEILNNITDIIRKYDYDFQDVFDMEDAKCMYFNILKFIKICIERR